MEEGAFDGVGLVGEVAVVRLASSVAEVLGPHGSCDQLELSPAPAALGAAPEAAWVACAQPTCGVGHVRRDHNCGAVGSVGDRMPERYQDGRGPRCQARTRVGRSMASPAARAE